MNLRNLFACLLLLLITGSAFGQEEVPPITVVHHENEFYITQFALWEKFTEEHPQDENAWYNLYKAARYQNFPAIFQDKEYKQEVTELVDRMGEAIPNTFEFHYVYAWHHGFGEENLPHLQKAWEIDSTRHRLTEDFFTYHYSKGEWKEASRFLKKWYAQRTMPPQLMHFCYNLMACAEENGILFLAGDNDSYPTWMLQGVLGLRPDLATLNAHLFLDRDFAGNALKRYEIAYEPADLDLLDRNSPTRWKDFSEFVRRLAVLNPDRKIYLPVTIQKEVNEELADDLYLVGTVFRYETENLDHIALLKRNWYRNMKMDYLDFTVYTDTYQYSPEGLPSTYLVYLYPAATLHHHFVQAGELQKAAEIKDFMQMISRKIGDPDHYLRFICADK